MTSQTDPGTPNSTPKRPQKMAANQSLNHLLNFTLPPRQSHQPQSLPRRNKKTGSQQVWNKERFVNAQYRFVMNPHGDYTVHFADPDIYFQWHDILQIIIPRTSAMASAAGSGEQLHGEGVTTCPICLSPPTAPRMTKCGHVFCYPCILHYLNTSDSLKWVRCPICFDSVNERQLKSVKWFDASAADDTDDTPAEASSSSSAADSALVATPRLGSILRMRLIQRPQITTMALPRSQTWPSDLLPPHQAPFHFLPDVFTFAKFMLATPAYLIADLTKDLDDLTTERRMLASMHDDLGISFVDAADVKIRQQLTRAAELETSQLQEAVENTLHVQQQIEGRHLHDAQRKREEEARRRSEIPADDVPQAFLATQTVGFTATAKAAAPASTPRPATPTRNPRQRRNINPPPPSTSTYYYYQAAAGIPVFLHPLDIRVLLSHFHNYAAFPDTISVRVESFAESTVNEDLRKRCKYLAHLPEGADVVFVEADLEAVVGPEGLKNFEQPLRMRRARREQKERRDNNARARAEEREKEKIVHVWQDAAPGHVVIPPALQVQRPLSPVQFEEHEEGEQGAPAAQPEPSGAWGARSFASAAQGQAQTVVRPVRREREAQGEEWELDMAWHELEQRSGRGGGKRRGTKMVVLGGAGGRRR